MTLILAGTYWPTGARAVQWLLLQRPIEKFHGGQSGIHQDRAEFRRHLLPSLQSTTTRLRRKKKAITCMQ